MAKPASNVIQYPWTFRLHYADGRIEDRTVEASCFSAAIFCLPLFKDVGKYRYEVLKHGRERR